jgi:competence protein ComEC
MLRALTLRLAAVATVLVTPAAARAQSEGVLRITFLDVGQGDAVLIRAAEGQTALIDAGPGRDIVLLLQALGVEQVDLLVASHPHADHIGGMLGVLNVFPVSFFMDNGQPYTTATYRGLMSALEARTDITYLEATPRTLSLGSAEIEVLPLPPYETDVNNRSVGLVVRYGEFAAFLSGDSEAAELTYFVTAGLVPDVTLLKAPHHGADNGFTAEFLRAARPEVVTISVGDNSYGHPGFRALSAYSSAASEIHRTDQEGTLTVAAFADGRYEVSGEGVAVAGHPAPAPQAPPAPAMLPRGLVLGVFADAPGNDHQNRNGEYAFLTNGSDSDVDVSGWTLCDAARHCFRFPTGARLQAGTQLVVFTGAGVSDGVRFYMNSGGAVWNNNGDTATLTDASGRIVARYVYE